MKLNTIVSLAGLVIGLALAPACKNKQAEQDKPAGSAAEPGSASGSASPTPLEPTPPAENMADHITVLAHHKKPKPSDPVRINFEKFEVVKATFDPAKIEGGTATIAIDLASFSTDSDERDEHLKSPAYLDVGSFATATVDIANVKKQGDGNTYTADATVQAHGKTKTYPVTFEVLDTTDDSIKIKAEQAFSRLDFGVGTDPAKNEDESVGTDLTIEMVLTLKKT